MKKFKSECKKNIILISTDDVRNYLSEYKRINGCSNITLDTIRRILSSFYQWLENEDLIMKNPLKRIHKIKSPVIVKTVFSDEEIELMRSVAAGNKRNLAIFSLLMSSGIRIGELVKMKIEDINLEEKNGIVRGKGNKERIIYFDVKTKICLQNYLNSMNVNDETNALFVTNREYKITKGVHGLSINTVEEIIRKIGNKVNVVNAHPHKFRRTVATKAIDKGMPLEQVQVLLGHSNIETTLHYAQVQQRNVMISYQKFIG